MEGSQKKWPIDLIKRGKRMDGAHPDIIWWQEPEESNGNGGSISILSAAAARSIGYEAHSFVPIAYPEKLATEIENHLRFLGRHGIEVPEDLRNALDSYRQFVAQPVNNPRGK